MIVSHTTDIRALHGVELFKISMNPSGGSGCATPLGGLLRGSNVATLACVAKNFIRGAKMSDSLLSLTATVKACKLSTLGLKEKRRSLRYTPMGRRATDFVNQ